jgi:hypothetical protein
MGMPNQKGSVIMRTQGLGGAPPNHATKRVNGQQPRGGQLACKNPPVAPQGVSRSLLVKGRHYRFDAALDGPITWREGLQGKGGAELGSPLRSQPMSRLAEPCDRVDR